jgi:hypothetical protein
MEPKKTHTLLTTLIVILGCGVLGFIFYSSDTYRAATPLVFIFGIIILLIPVINKILKALIPPKTRSLVESRLAAQDLKLDEARFWREGIPQLVTNLYFGHVMNYPEWIQVSRDYVPSSVTNANRTEEGWVRLLLYYADYLFPYKEWSLSNSSEDSYKQAVLEVVREGERVLTLRVTETIDKKGVARWEPTAVESFVRGEWTKDFQNLKAEVIAIIKDREREARES